ncbi:hypothetical protein AVEN_122612-1 [Araneus ventricosus]|uniref:Uncharacterized protein n=1 Tax=Araneus ventricosus TaxID=182803 RepID=A0A4Y2UTU1_ARAVE|nr:hypothetical protein AVEN_243093-1 [Araneus ventricosus]GBO15614.1 hypothetical protein AVEN_122612-1 [Araneus ventricosus]
MVTVVAVVVIPLGTAYLAKSTNQVLMMKGREGNWSNDLGNLGPLWTGGWFRNRKSVGFGLDSHESGENCSFNLIAIYHSPDANDQDQGHWKPVIVPVCSYSTATWQRLDFLIGQSKHWRLPRLKVIPVL